MDPDNTVIPRRGGNDFMGPYVGGSPIDSTYQLLTSEESFKCTLQLRNAKTLLGIESDLRKSSASSTSLKYDGKLKLDSSDITAKELDKGEFLLAIDEAVMSYGLQTFFYLPDQTGTIRYLAEEPHMFTIDNAMSEHDSRMIEPSPVVDDNDEETVDSICSRFKCYDKYERFDISLSCRILETLLSQDIKGTIRIKYGHLSNFKSLPGQVIFMMALDVSNASAIQDIDEATQAFKQLTLTSYPGENVVDFATEAQRLIKIMSTGYALPYKTGSVLLSKVESTGSSYFNQQIFHYQSQVKLMERSVGPLVDPKSIARHVDYPTLGPLGLCALIQEEYGELKRSNEWPAISATIPQANNSHTNRAVNPNGHRCFRCGSETHLANDLICPDHPAHAAGGDRTGNGPTARTGTSARTGNVDNSNPNPATAPNSDPSPTASIPPNARGTNSASAPASTWKYIHPADKDQKLEVNGKTYYFCEKCVCHHTGKTGFYNTTHSTSQHAPGLGRCRTDNPTSTPSNSNRTGGDAQGNMSAATSPKTTPAPTTKTEDALATDVDDEANELQFEGAFHSDITDEGVWMSEIQDELDSDKQNVTAVDFTPMEESDDSFWTVPDADLGSGLPSVTTSRVAVFPGLAFTHVDIDNTFALIQGPIILQGCMTELEHNLRRDYVLNTTSKTNPRNELSFTLDETSMRSIGDSLVQHLEKVAQNTSITKTKFTSSYSSHPLKLINNVPSTLHPNQLNNFAPINKTPPTSPIADPNPNLPTPTVSPIADPTSPNTTPSVSTTNTITYIFLMQLLTATLTIMKPLYNFCFPIQKHTSHSNTLLTCLTHASTTFTFFICSLWWDILLYYASCPPL